MKENIERYIVENKRYFDYYRKPILSMRFKKRKWSISSYINLAKIWLEPVDLIENVYLNRLYRCLNNPNSLTTIIRNKEQSYAFISEEDIKVYKTTDAIAELKKFYTPQLDKRLVDLTFGDVNLRIKSSGYSRNLKIIDAVNCSDGDRAKNIIPAFQIICPLFKKANADDCDYVISGIIDFMYSRGYNFVNMQRFMTKTQPFNDKIVLLFITFEAIYGDIVDELGDDLFHITSISALSGIKAHGIMPQQCKSGEFQHPKRVYLFSNAKFTNMLLFIEERFKNANSGQICLLKINKDMLVNSQEFKSGKMLFYVDPMFEDSFGKTAIFTDSVIPVKFIDDKVVIFKQVGGKFMKSGTAKLSEIR